MPTISVQAIARELDGFNKRKLVRVDLAIDGTERNFALPPRISLWFPEDEAQDFATAERMAREELHRISSQIAAAVAHTPDPSTPSDPGESERERKWREGQERSDSGWAV